MIISPPYLYGCVASITLYMTMTAMHTYNVIVMWNHLVFDVLFDEHKMAKSFQVNIKSCLCLCGCVTWEMTNIRMHKAFKVNISDVIAAAPFTFWHLFSPCVCHRYSLHAVHFAEAFQQSSWGTRKPLSHHLSVCQPLLYATSQFSTPSNVSFPFKFLVMANDIKSLLFQNTSVRNGGKMSIAK